MVVDNNKVFIQCLEKLIICKHEVDETNMKCEDHYYANSTRISKIKSMKKQQINLNNKTILVTGSPGFIGANLVIRLLITLTAGTVVSLDNMNDYYEVSLKEWRLKQIEKLAASSPVNHVFIRGSIGDKALIDSLFKRYHFDIVVNLAAQAGVRYSIENPDA